MQNQCDKVEVAVQVNYHCEYSVNDVSSVTYRKKKNDERVWRVITVEIECNKVEVTVEVIYHCESRATKSK